MVDVAGEVVVDEVGAEALLAVVEEAEDVAEAGASRSRLTITLGKNSEPLSIAGEIRGQAHHASIVPAHNARAKRRKHFRGMAFIRAMI